MELKKSEKYISGRPLPEKEFIPNTILYECPQMYITVTNKNFPFLPKGSHSHDGYEFLLSDTVLPSLGVDNKAFKCYKNDILPINPGQQHGAIDRIDNAQFLSIMISSKLMKDIAHSVYDNYNAQFANEVSRLSGTALNLIAMFIAEAKLSHPGAPIILESLSFHLATVLLRELKNNMPCTEKLLNYNETRRIKDVINYMYEFYNSDCTIEELAKIADLSSYHFIRIFKNKTGKTPYECLIDIRVEKAKQMLTDKRYTITDVCMECGFNNPSHFTRLFKQRTGVTPTYFRSLTLR